MNVVNGLKILDGDRVWHSDWQHISKPYYVGCTVCVYFSSAEKIGMATWDYVGSNCLNISNTGNTLC